MPLEPVHCVIPARIGSSRFPGKPLYKLCGREMILWTMERAHQAGCFSKIVCATDDSRIAHVVKSAGYEAVLTGNAATGSDRVALASKQLGLDLVVNLQGDEPTVDLDLLRHVAMALAKEPEYWVSAFSPLRKEDLLKNSVVKVAVSSDGFATDFRRSVPENEFGQWAEHRGIYAYSFKSREEFFALPQAPREQAESLEQLRILGKTPIRMVETQVPSYSVDLLSDVPTVEDQLKSLLT